MSKPKLHLDMDTSRRDLHRALVTRGYDVTRTPNPEITEDASDEYQLLWATSHNRIIFTFNIKDYLNLAKKHPSHGGIILANQKTTSPDKMISELSRVIEENSAGNWTGVVRLL